MTTASNVLRRVLANYFYKANAALFTFAFFVLFGLPYSPLAFHLSIIKGIIASYQFLIVVLCIWFLYSLKCTDYIIKHIRDERQSFLFCLNCMSPLGLFLHMLYVQVLVYLPVLLYAAVVTVIAFMKHKFLFAIIIISCNLAITALAAFTYVYAIQRKRLINISLALPVSDLNFTTPFFLIPLYFLWLHRKQMLLITKTFSLFVLNLFIGLYQPEQYDIRPLQLCLLLIAASHSAIIFQVRSFEEERLTFYRILPVGTFARFLKNLLMFTVLLVPELLLILKGLHTHFLLHDYPQLLLLPVSLLSMFYTVLLIEETGMDQLTRIVFGIMAGCFFIILYNPGIYLPTAILAIGFALFNSYYFQHEKKHR